MSKTKTKIQELLTRLGKEKISSCLDVTPRAVDMCVNREGIPSNWYKAIREMAYQKDIELDISLFNFKDYELPSEASNELPQ